MILLPATFSIDRVRFGVLHTMGNICSGRMRLMEVWNECTIPFHIMSEEMHTTEHSDEIHSRSDANSIANHE